MSKELRAQQAALEELWKQGLSGHELLQRHTDMVDSFIVDHFTSSEAIRANKGKVALIALGGYGRRELYPFSDIDLLLLHDWRSGKAMQAVAESILYPLWDAGFEVGHSVRSIKDSIRFASEDFFFQVALLDARLLTGSASLFNKLLARYRKKILDGKRKVFVRTMEEFRANRRKRYGSHAYLLEPHIKEGKGGMRDIQAMLWVGKAVYGLPDLQAMTDAGLLTDREQTRFTHSWNMLARIRNRLHYISRRKNDQLIFEYQEEMATSFGYQDREGQLAVEQFMRDVYGHLQSIAVITDLFFEHVHESLGLAGKADREREIEKAIAERGGTLHLTDPNAPEERPHLLMRVFLQAARTGLPLHHRLKQQIHAHLHLVDDKFRTSRRVARPFLELLTTAKDPFPVLETMLETGLLSAYIPEFSAVESLAQHDLYHIYTVDRHQLQTVAELHNLREQEADLFTELDNTLHLLFLAALLHDIGKGQRTDHSQLGAELILQVGARLGLSATENETLSFLVRYHLYLPENAMRRDLEDQEFIRQAAELIGDTGRLAMLYLLTIADSKATGPSAWSDWKATLLAEFYLKIKACLDAGCVSDTTVDQAEGQGASWLRERLRTQIQNEEGLRLDPADLPNDYLMAFTPEMVGQHLRLHRDYASQLQQRVLLFPEQRQGYWSLLMLSKDRPGLLAKLCGVLALHDFSVLAAQIFTWPDQTVVDVLDVKPVVAKDVNKESWQALEEDLNKAVNYRLDVGRQLHGKKMGWGVNKKRKIQQLEQKVIVDNTSSRRFTVIEVYGADAPGALYKLTQTLSDFDLDIHRARIATEVEQLIDIFYVLKRDGARLADHEEIEQVRQTLSHILTPEEQIQT